MIQITDIDPDAAYKLLLRSEAVLIDVREKEEIYQTSIDGAVHVPMSVFDPSLIPIDSGKKIVFLCTHGIRSSQVSQYLVSQGLLNEAYNLTGGIVEWIKVGLPFQTNIKKME